MLLRILLFVVFLSLLQRIWRWARPATQDALEDPPAPDPLHGRDGVDSLTDQTIEDADYEELP